MQSLLRVFVGVSLFTGLSQASTIYTFSATGTLGGQPENVSASLTTNDNGTLDITLNNLESNPTSVIQNLSDFSFVLSDMVTGMTGLSSSSGTELTVASNGSYTVGSPVSTGWVLSGSGTSFEISVLGTSAGPSHTIIGPSSNGTYSGGTYSNANGSIAGNGPHNPFLESGSTFVLSLPGITSETVVDSATFSFGTAAGSDLDGTCTSNNCGASVQSITPEPISMSLMGAGLLLIGLLGRKRIRG